MNYNEIINTIKITRDYIYKYVKIGQIVVDCTVGNGNDTLELARLIGETGKVYGFDIQQTAIDITYERLKENHLLDRTNLIKDSHSNIDLYIKEKVDFIIYNLGYLPKGDKTIKTNKFTTVSSLNKALELLKENGVMLITCYVGHDGGMEEKEGVESLLKSLNQKDYNVVKHEFINQNNYPPILYGVEKSKKGRK